MPEFNFEVIQSLEKQAIEAVQKREELQNALKQLNAERDMIIAEMNHYGGSATALTQAAEKILAEANLTTKDYVTWKELESAIGNETKH